MPEMPKSRRRPWLPEHEAQGGRLVTNKFYHSTAWRKFRAWYILLNPLCELCQKKEKATPGKVVDHIKQINRSDAYDTQQGVHGEPLDEDNVQTLCTRCHAIKSAKERHQKKG